MSDGYDELAKAIVLQAYRDWCEDCKKLASGKGNVDEIKRDMLDILKFVKSDWYAQLNGNQHLYFYGMEYDKNHGHEYGQ